MQKTNFNSGNIDKYRKDLKVASENSETFTTISTGLSRKIILGNGKILRYYGTQKASKFIDGSYLVPMVLREINTYIEKNGVPNYELVKDVQLFNIDKIHEAIKKKNVKVVGVDINACYWTTAYLLGYISHELYSKGLGIKKKAGLLVSIGCLNKRPLIKKYKDGELIESRFDDDYYLRYCPFYWNIIKKTYDIMMNTFNSFKDNWYMFLTDCVFVDESKVLDAQKLLKDLGYDSKTHNIEFKEFQNGRLVWYDFKDERLKGIYAMRRDVQAQNDLINIAKGLPPR